MPPVVIAVAAFVVEYAAVISIVGVALNVVGAVTGNATLSKIGGIMGMVGGIAGIAGAMGAGSALAEAGAGAAAEAGLEAGAGAVAEAGLETGLTEVATDGIVGNSLEAVTADQLGQVAVPEMLIDSSMPAVAEATAEGAATGLLDSTAATMDAPAIDGTISQSNTNFDAIADSSSAATPSVDAPTANSSSMKMADPYLNETNKFLGQVKPPVDSSSTSIGKWWDGLSSSTKNNIQQMGGKAVGSLFEGWTAEQKMEFERPRLALDQDKWNTQKSNANAQPSITFKKVQPAGLLNSTGG